MPVQLTLSFEVSEPAKKPATLRLPPRFASPAPLVLYGRVGPHCIKNRLHVNPPASITCDCWRPTDTRGQVKVSMVVTHAGTAFTTTEAFKCADVWSGTFRMVYDAAQHHDLVLPVAEANDWIDTFVPRREAA